MLREERKEEFRDEDFEFTKADEMRLARRRRERKRNRLEAEYRQWKELETHYREEA